MDEAVHVAGRDWSNDADLDAPDFNDNFNEVVSTLAGVCPVSRSEVGTGYWIANGFDTVRACAQDWQTFSNTGGFQPNAATEGPTLYPQELDPPHHTQWRNLLAPYFTPTAVKNHEPATVEHAHFLIDAFIDRGECDFIPELAGPFPGRLFFTRFLGVPVEDLDFMRQALHAALLGPVEERGEGWRQMSEYLEAHLRRREQLPPQGDVVDAVLRGVVREDGEPSTFREKVMTVTDLTAGGLGTTTYLLASIMRYLADNPRDRHLLAEDDSLIPGAVEELIRAHPPTVATGRTATRDTELGGRAIAKGDMVMLNFASACLDPAVVSDPLRVDISRETPTNAAFGFGPHRCIGNHLGRQNLSVVLREFLSRIPDFEITPGTEPTFTSGITREMYSLQLSFPRGGGSRA